MQYKIVTGEEGVDQFVKEKGVPEFWLNVLKAYRLIEEKIQERDEEALSYLEDIRSSRTTEHKGFKLEFLFKFNPFFKNQVLTKTYLTENDDDPTLEAPIGTEIEWEPGMCLTGNVLKQRPYKRVKNSDPATDTGDGAESFFDFFSSYAVPENDADLNESEVNEQMHRFHMDYYIGF